MRIGEKGFELSAAPTPKPPMAHQIIGGPWAAFLFGAREPRFVTYASFVLGTLVVLVIDFSRPSGYTCPTDQGKETTDDGGDAKPPRSSPLELYGSVCRERVGLTTSQYITQLLTEYYEMKENGGKQHDQRWKQNHGVPDSGGDLPLQMPQAIVGSGF